MEVEAQRHSSHATQTILYIEDDAANRCLMEMVIRMRTTWGLIACGSGEEGLELVREHAPAAIVVDLGLPGIDGVETARRLRADPQTRDIPLIALSAHTDFERDEPALPTLFDAVLSKPFDIEGLLRSISKAAHL
jgi:CheY-like chemotaxis protein